MRQKVTLEEVQETMQILAKEVEREQAKLEKRLAALQPAEAV